jgi:hypothetical protein
MANQSEPFGCLTSYCKVFPVSRDKTIAGWIIRLLKRKGGKTKVKGQEKKSQQYYESQIAAENAMFEFRKSFESPKSKKQLDHWEISLLSSSIRVELIVDEGRNQQ